MDALSEVARAYRRSRHGEVGRWQDVGNAAGRVSPSVRRRRNQHRTIWISDTHLGTPDCKATLLCDFLRNNDCELLYLVGDIVDGWRLARSWFWHESQSAVIDEILRKVQSGTRVVYIPGNHDETFRDYVGLCLGGVELAVDAIHETADGRRLLVIHGDEFDGVVRYAPWLAHVGDRAHVAAMHLNNVVASVRSRVGLPYWSLSHWLKSRVKDAVEFVGRFEDAIASEARRRSVDGVVCGHIHKAEIRQIGDILYCNDGDWVESCTALTEDHAGGLQIVTWREVIGVTAHAPTLARAAE